MRGFFFRTVLLEHGGIFCALKELLLNLGDGRMLQYWRACWGLRVPNEAPGPVAPDRNSKRPQPPPTAQLNAWPTGGTYVDVAQCMMRSSPSASFDGRPRHRLL